MAKKPLDNKKRKKNFCHRVKCVSNQQYTCCVCNHRFCKAHMLSLELTNRVCIACDLMKKKEVEMKSAQTTKHTYIHV